jgi:hypothetical protein
MSVSLWKSQRHVSWSEGSAVHTDTSEFWDRNGDKGASGSKLSEER